ncbi:MAG TPA: hypothetical protein ENN30_00045 [Candidatus Woesearchaeota archaeon]|nr:hypothetical protein [Candidatus Woesearchaeota archaeon]
MEDKKNTKTIIIIIAAVVLLAGVLYFTRPYILGIFVPGGTLPTAIPGCRKVKTEWDIRESSMHNINSQIGDAYESAFMDGQMTEDEASQISTLIDATIMEIDHLEQLVRQNPDCFIEEHLYLEGLAHQKQSFMKMQAELAR